jgi:hypothetical protein
MNGKFEFNSFSGAVSFFRLRQIFTNHSAPSLTTLTPKAVVEPVETTKGNVIMANSTTVHTQPQHFAAQSGG